MWLIAPCYFGWIRPSLSRLVMSAQALAWFIWDSIRLVASTEARNGGRKLTVYPAHVHSFHILALAQFHHTVDNLYFSCSLFNPRRLNIGPGRWEVKDEMKTPLSPLMRYLVLGWSITPLPNMNRLRGIQASPMGRMASRRLDMCFLRFLWVMSQKILYEFFLSLGQNSFMQ